MLHLFISRLSPWQPAPPLAGTGFTQNLTRDWFPPLHVTSQTDQSVKFVHPPLTEALKFKLMNNSSIHVNRCMSTVSNTMSIKREYYRKYRRRLSSYFWCVKNDRFLRAPEISYQNESFSPTHYRNDPKFSDRYAWANRADPDQTDPTGAVRSGSTRFAIPSASFELITLW